MEQSEVLNAVLSAYYPNTLQGMTQETFLAASLVLCLLRVAILFCCNAAPFSLFASFRVCMRG